MGNTIPHKWWLDYAEECAAPTHRSSDPGARVIAMLEPGESADYQNLRVTHARDGRSVTLEILERGPTMRWAIDTISSPLADVLAEMARLRALTLDVPEHLLFNKPCEHRTAYRCARCNVRCCMACDVPLVDDGESKTIGSRWCQAERCQREMQIEHGTLDVVPRGR